MVYANFLRRTVVMLLALLALAGCGGQELYVERFEEPGNWRVGDDFDATGEVIGGVYRFEVDADVGIFWTTAGEEFRDGRYSVEVTQTGGPIDAGYGLMLRVNDNNDSFYLFQISGDGYVWIGRCLAACSEETLLVNDWWFQSETVQQGLGETNKLTVLAESGNFIFFVNDIEVGRATDTILASGDIGLFVETIGLGGVTVEFDNVMVEP